jgi:hypothetical protein
MPVDLPSKFCLKDFSAQEKFSVTTQIYAARLIEGILLSSILNKIQFALQVLVKITLHNIG